MKEDHITDPDLSADSLVHALITEGKPEANATALTGFLRGPGEENGNVRLFLDPELKAWIDIPAEHVRHRRHINGPSGEQSMIWVENEWMEQSLLTSEQREAIAEQFLLGEFAAEILLTQTLADGVGYVAYALLRTTMCTKHCPK